MQGIGSSGGRRTLMLLAALLTSGRSDPAVGYFGRHLESAGDQRKAIIMLRQGTEYCVDKQRLRLRLNNATTTRKGCRRLNCARASGLSEGQLCRGSSSSGTLLTAWSTFLSASRVAMESKLRTPAGNLPVSFPPPPPPLSPPGHLQIALGQTHGV